jgi:hypothetical protein
MPLIDKLRNAFSSSKNKSNNVIRFATKQYKDLKHKPEYGIVGITFNMSGTNKMLKVLVEDEFVDNSEIYQKLQSALDDKRIETLITGTQGYIAFTGEMLDDNKFINDEIDIAELVKINFEEADDDSELVGIIMKNHELPDSITTGGADYITECYRLMEQVINEDWNPIVMTDHNIGRDMSTNNYRIIDWFL